MKKFLICTLCLAVLGMASVAGAKDFTVATFNCEFLTRPKVHVKFGYDLNWAKVDPAIKKQWEEENYRNAKFAEAAKAVAKVIKTIDADVIVLTEVGKNDEDVNELYGYVQDLGANYTAWAAAKSADSYTQQSVAVFSRYPFSDVQKTIEGKESYFQELDDPESEKETGLSKGMRVVVDVNGKAVIIYGVHFKSESGGHEADAQRIAQASIVRRHVLLDLAMGANVIVAGDLNDKRGQPAVLRVRGLNDIWEDLIQTGRPEYFKEGGLDTRWTYVYEGQRQQIDHILVSRFLEEGCKSPKIEARTLDHNDKLASDHKPLIVKFNMK